MIYRLQIIYKKKGQVPVHAITDKKEIDCLEGN